MTPGPVGEVPARPGRDDVLVVGAGLIGTSIALALADRRRVLLHDVDPRRLDEAVAATGAQPWDGDEAVPLAVVAVPPAVTGAVASGLLRSGVARTVTHVGGVQSHVQAEVEAGGGRFVEQFCGSHPMAGAETAGPAGARSDLFAGRAWAVCPGPSTSAGAVSAVESLARDCGADPVLLTPVEHDEAVALVSHLPQLVASALAAVVADAGTRTDLAGPGIVDTTRIAGSPSALWGDLLSANAREVAPLARAVARRLDAAAAALDTLVPGAIAPVDARQASGRGSADRPAPAEGAGHLASSAPATRVLAALLEDGRRGRARIPLKRGSADPGGEVRVVLLDQPGELVRALSVAADAGVNVEDLRLDHLRGRPRGILALSVATADVEPLRASLSTSGFAVTSSRPAPK